MLLALAQWLQSDYDFLRIFNYLTFHAVMVSPTALVIGLGFGPWVIRRLIELEVGQAVRSYGPQTYLVKVGMPTMGGVLALVGIVVPTLLWTDWGNRFIRVVLLATLGYGAAGQVDDYRKATHRDPKDMSSRERFFWQTVIGLFATAYLVFSVSEASNMRVFKLFMKWVRSGLSLNLLAKSHLIVPFFKEISYPLGVFGFIILTHLVIVGSGNAVNLTDGLDGPVIMPVVPMGSVLDVLVYVMGSTIYSKYLLFPHILGVGELLIFCLTMVGAGFAFLQFGVHPARVFTGDIGVLAFGDALGIIAVIVCQEVMLFTMGGIFVAETVSVMLQVTWFRFAKKRCGEGRRLFHMAPLHHHFELSGQKETQVVVRFWVITMMLVPIGLSTPKLW